MALVFSDDFNRADNANLGGNWVDNGGDMQVKSNQLFASGLSSSYNTTPVGGADQRVGIELEFESASGKNYWVMPYARATGTTKFDNAYWIYLQYETAVNINCFIELYKRVGGTQTQLGSRYTIGLEPPGGNGWHRADVSCEGTSIKGWFDGDDVITATDSSHSDEGVHGVRMNNGFYADNYEVHDFSAGGTPVNDQRGAKLTGQVSTNDERGAKVTGTTEEQASDNRNLFIAGGDGRYKETFANTDKKHGSTTALWPGDGSARMDPDYEG